MSDLRNTESGFSGGTGFYAASRSSRSKLRIREESSCVVARGQMVERVALERGT